MAASQAVPCRDGVLPQSLMDWSPDGSTMYYINSLTHEVTAFDYDALRGISNERPALTLPEGTGAPDGMTVATDGTLWVAHWGGGRVTRWTAMGELIQTVDVPANLVCFWRPGA